MSAAIIYQKRGDTFSRTCTYKRDGVAYDLTGCAIVAQVRDQFGTLVDTLVATLLTQSGATLGQFTLTRAYALVAAWPVNTLSMDIQYTFPDATRITSGTIQVVVQEDITQ